MDQDQVVQYSWIVSWTN